MQAFGYKKVGSAEEIAKIAADGVRFLAGGTTLVDLMKLDVETPRVVIDVNALPFTKIEREKDGGLMIGAMVRNADLANDEYVKKNYAVLSQAILNGASAQLRNRATTAGNLLQRTRCVYFRDTSKPCNKRKPKSGCSALGGHNRNLAILGGSNDCIATNPSDQNVALMALDARVHIRGMAGERIVRLSEFYLLPGSTPEKETVLQPGDLITAVSVPGLPAGTTTSYLKLRDRASYEFALASAAVVATVSGGRVQRVRIAMGGIGTIPWRVESAEKILEGTMAGPEKIAAAVAEFLKGAKPASENGFKVELAKRCLTHTLSKALKV